MTRSFGRNGEPIHIDFRKWPDTPHWQFTMRALGEDAHGLWVWAPPGTPAQRGSDPPATFSNPGVKLITPDRWWTAIWNAGGKHELYVDIATPVEWDGSRATFIDLDLDVTRYRATGEVAVLDEDEFLDHQVRLGYPPNVVDQARATTARIALDVERRVEPFGEVAAAWLAQAVALSR
jgi:hypothetical protein